MTVLQLIPKFLWYIIDRIEYYCLQFVENVKNAAD